MTELVTQVKLVHTLCLAYRFLRVSVGDLRTICLEYGLRRQGGLMRRRGGVARGGGAYGSGTRGRGLWCDVLVIFYVTVSRAAFLL